MATITPFARLSADHVEQVRSAADAAASVDGVEPLSEAFVLALPREGEHLLALDGTSVIGYASTVADGSLEAFVAPDHRTKGVGAALLGTSLQRRPDARPWAHGDLPASRALGERLGLQVVRELLVLSRPVQPGDEQDPPLPDGFAHRTFRPGSDEQRLLAVNSAAFVDHPEQGSLDDAGLAERMDQPWFDPDGVILLERAADDGPLVGFHWTKIDPPGGPVGEVYVVGVHPDLHGRGLAGPLTRLGLAHLARRGVTEVELYVEADNTPALATYGRAGFGRKAVHVMYAPSRSPEVHDQVQG
ncbi:mycothiol synthase [Janibacter limosus]|jgi:mycothiol synthase|uniref:Mycothiol acetyltransferase n=1 Tax=Janibacter limosus TaxID=53458 RepID=A0A4P6MW93_9MICO|nr:mycothiol synthase [Janibacter limosus]QBF47246.1 mycothiol synthase [Janibacter limosus]